MSVYRQMLQTAFDKKKAKNAKYSRRAFARLIGVDAGLLSRILAGKSELSLAAAGDVAKALTWTEDEERIFREAIVTERGEKSLGKERRAVPVKHIDAEAFEVISRLYHYALLELTFVEGFHPEPRWIAKQLGITVLEAEAAVSRLKRLGLLELRDGAWVKVDKHIQVKDRDKTTPALKQQQREILSASLRALDRETLDRRCTAGITMASNPERIPVARDMINKFLFELCSYLEAGKKSEIYQLSVSLFPLKGNFQTETTTSSVES